MKKKETKRMETQKPQTRDISAHNLSPVNFYPTHFGQKKLLQHLGKSEIFGTVILWINSWISLNTPKEEKKLKVRKSKSIH